MFRQQVIEEWPRGERQSALGRGNLASRKWRVHCIADFELVSELQADSQTTVYRAWQPAPGLQVAVKKLAAGLPDPEEWRRRLQALAAVEHQHLAKILAWGADFGQPYYAMELVEGASLLALWPRLRSQVLGVAGLEQAAWQRLVSRAVEECRRAEAPLAIRPFPEPTSVPAIGALWHGYVRHIVGLWIPVAEAAHALHEAGLVHGSIRPSNIRLSPDGNRAVLLEAQIAAGDQQAAHLPLPAVRFLSPEQIQAGAQPDRRSDVYALGAVFWEMLALRPLLAADGDKLSRTDLFKRIQTQAPEPLSQCQATVGPDLEAVVQKCLDKVPAKRYATAQELAKDLRRCLEAPLSADSRPRSVPQWDTQRQNPKPKAPEAAAGIKGAPAKEKNGEPLSPSAKAAPPKPREPITNTIGMKLVYMPPGTFTMGSPKEEEDRGADEDQHEVEISHGFYLSAYEVTQEQYQKVMGQNPSWYCAEGGGKNNVDGLDTRRFPVEMISWHDAVAFCKELSRREGEIYRLPTEAEWEYACRARTATAFHYGNSLFSKRANFDGHLGRPEKVGSYAPNNFGLYDMHGNVWEWCQDWYGGYYYSQSPPRDPQGPRKGQCRVLRGGSFVYLARYVRSAFRNGVGPAVRYYDFGFRPARTVTP